MKRRHKVELWVGMVAAGTALFFLLPLTSKEHPIALTGVVIRQDADPRKQVPLAGVEITAADALALRDSQSDSTGLFRLLLHPALKPNEPVVLYFRHPDYKPLTLTLPAANKLYVVRMSPISVAERAAPTGPTVFIAQLSIRYSEKTSTTEDVGSALKSFEVSNVANLNCRAPDHCSPDGMWKATTAAMSLDAGEGSQFRNPRVSCIAGPCPFTKVDSVHLAEGGRVLNITVRDWSDPATFLVEAEVVHPTTGEIIRQSFPAILGRNLNFTVPEEAEGVSLEAEVDGTSVVFPLGPGVCLSWADCNVTVEKDRTSRYACELKPGYEFR